MSYSNLFNNFDCQAVLDNLRNKGSMTMDELLSVLQNDVDSRTDVIDDLIQSLYDEEKFEDILTAPLDMAYQYPSKTGSAPSTYWYPKLRRGRVAVTYDVLIAFLNALLRLSGSPVKYADLTETVGFSVTDGDGNVYQVEVYPNLSAPYQRFENYDDMISRGVRTLARCRRYTDDADTPWDGIVSSSIQLHPQPPIYEYLVSPVLFNANSDEETGDGFYSFSSLISSLAEQSTIYDLFSQGIDSCYTDATTSVSDFFAGLSVQMGSASAPIAAVLSNIKSNGINKVGILTSFRSWCDAVSHVEAVSGSEDQITFTDNSAFVPQSILSGVIRGIGSSATVIGAALSGAFGAISLVAGICISVVSRIATGLINVVLQGGRVQIDPKSSLSCNAIGIFQNELQYGALPYGIKEKLLRYGLVVTCIPGNYMIIFLKDIVYTASGDISDLSTVGCECHPCYNYDCDDADLKNLLVGMFQITTSGGYDVLNVNIPRSAEVRRVFEPTLRNRGVIDLGLDSEDQDTLVRKSTWISMLLAFICHFTPTAASSTTISFRLNSVTSYAIRRFLYNSYLYLTSTSVLTPSWKSMTGKDGDFTGCYNQAFFTSVGSALIGWDADTDTTINGVTLLSWVDASIAMYISDWEDEILTIGSQAAPTYTYNPPSLDTSSLWTDIIALAVVTTVLTVTATLVAVKVRKTLARRRAISSAKTEKAWYSFTDDPTAENYAAYRKAAKRNNLQSSIFGGSKYNVSSYWGDVEGDDASVLSKLQSLVTGENSDVTVEDVAGATVDIARLITG